MLVYLVCKYLSILIIIISGVGATGRLPKEVYPGCWFNRLVRSVEPQIQEKWGSALNSLLHEGHSFIGYKKTQDTKCKEICRGGGGGSLDYLDDRSAID